MSSKVMTDLRAIPLLKDCNCTAHEGILDLQVRLRTEILAEGASLDWDYSRLASDP